MSTGANCRFWELKPGKWFYSLQEWPYGATEDYVHHGPFDGEEAAMAHLHRNYANPGGHSIFRHAELAADPRRLARYMDFAKEARR